MSWQTFFEKDRNILILCICLSAVIWVFNRMSQPTRSSINVRVHIEVPETFVLSEWTKRTIRVGVEGTGWQLLQLFREKKIQIDLAPVEATTQQEWGSDQLRLRLSDLPAFSEVQIVSINPARLVVSLDSATSKMVPIKLPRRIEYARGYSNLAPLSIRPQAIKVSGPKTKISKLTSWPLDSLILTKVRNNLKDSIDARLSEAYQEVYALSPSHITYRLDVSEFTELKQICPIRSPSDSISLFPRRGVVRLRGPADK